MRFQPRQHLPLIVLALLLLGIGVAKYLAAADRRAAVRAVQQWQVAGMDDGLTLAEECAAHARLSTASWVAAWSDDERLVAVELRLDRFEELREGLPALAAVFTDQVSHQPSWAGVADDQPVVLATVFQVNQGEDGKPAVQLLNLRLSEGWVVFKPDLVEAWEKSLGEAMAQADDTSTMKRFQLRHDGDRALLNAGATYPVVAGPGLKRDALAGLHLLLNWR